MSLSTPSPLTDSQARWSPFQCPSCFSLFRVQRRHAGNVGECPSCHTRIKVPEPGAKTSTSPENEVSSAAVEDPKRPIVARVAETIDPAKAKSSQSGWNEDSRRKKRHFGGGQDRIDWEEGGSRHQSSVTWMTVVSIAFGIALLLAGSAFYLQRVQSDKSELKKERVVGSAADIRAIEDSLQLSASEETTKDQTEVEEMVEKMDTFDLDKVLAIVKNFLDAKSVEEQAKFVRESERVLPLMSAYYENHEFEVLGFRKLEEGKISFRQSFLSTSVRLKDFSLSPIALEKIGEEYFVDWESWVGHCEMSVADILKNKPKEPVEVRAYVRPQDYYNYYFNDDKKWFSLRLTFSDEERSLWGYLELDSELYRKMKASPSHPMILKIAYPEEGRGKDQVKIVDWVANGWVKGIPENKKEEDE